MNLHIIKNRYKFFIFSGILAFASILSLFVWGLNFSIDFTGGSFLEIGISQNINNPEAADLSSKIQEKMPEIGEVRIQPTDNGFLIRMKTLSEEEHQKILEILNDSLKNSAEEKDNSKVVEEKRFESVGPVIGMELRNKTFWAISLAVIMMIIYIAWAFRKVSKPVASWKYGMGAIIALIHDILIVIGIFSVLGHFFISFEVDILFITALLTILGYSVNDTIVVYDRTRENLIYNPQITFEATVEKSVNETMTRSINTGLATLFVLAVLYLFGGETIKNFNLTLFLGIIFGTYSSIFIASPLLVVWQKLKKN